jgi:altronate dehydratase large subunit
MPEPTSVTGEIPEASREHAGRDDGAASASVRLDAALLHPDDDVATALFELAAGSVVRLQSGTSAREVTLRENIAVGHKFAVRDLASGECVRKYGDSIGRTTSDVSTGAWVHVHNLATAARRDADERPALRVRTDVHTPSRQARAGASRSRTFDGYRRTDGRVGVRNHVLVLSPTGLTSAAANRVSALVHGTISVTSGFGRGQVALDAQLHFDTLLGLATHPNVAGTLVVSAGDDITQSFVDAIARTGKPVVGLSLPGVREDALALVDAGVRAATRLVRDASALRRESCALADLCIAVECGHSDATSGLVCNPLAGRMMESVVAEGGQAMFSETVEWTGAEHLLAARAIDSGVASDILRAVADREDMVRRVGADIRAQNPGPQNRAGGLTTIEEKALGAIAKGGQLPIHGVLRPAQRPRGPGLFIMDTPYFSPESMTAMIAGGAQIVVFTTGAGNSYCSLVAPTLKLSANPDTCERLTEQIDIVATDVLRRTVTLDAMAAAAIDKLVDVAGGTLTFGEIVGEGGEVVSRLGASI